MMNKIIKQIIKTKKSITHEKIIIATRLINTAVLIIIMIIAAVLLSIVKEQLSKIGSSAASISSDMFDMNSAITGYVMTGQIGDYVYNQGE